MRHTREEALLLYPRDGHWDRVETNRDAVIEFNDLFDPALIQRCCHEIQDRYFGQDQAIASVV